MMPCECPVFDCARVLTSGSGVCYVTGPLSNLASDSGRGRAWARCGHSVHFVSPGSNTSTIQTICRDSYILKLGLSSQVILILLKSNNF